MYRTLFHFMMGEQTDRFIALSLHTEFAEESRLLSGEQTDRFIALSLHTEFAEESRLLSGGAQLAVLIACSVRAIGRC